MPPPAAKIRAARRLLSAVALAASLGTTTAAWADLIVVEATQVGGFYDGGATPDNLPGFQNYFVGYGTSPGGMRTPERRSFFWFELPEFETEVISATLTLKLVAPGGLIFGAGPGDPETDPIFPDAAETFRLGFTLFDPVIVTDPVLSPASVDTIFESFKSTTDATPIAVPLTIAMGAPLPPDGFFDIPFTPAGLTFLGFSSGMDVVLTGWMPTWTEDFRIVPDSDPPELLEGSELFWGFSDVHLDFPVPILTLLTAPVPEAGGLLLLAATGAAVGVGVNVRRRLFR
jgi:hypothetical protein